MSWLDDWKKAPMVPAEYFFVGEIAYLKKRGWSGYPLQVLGVSEINESGYQSVIVADPNGLYSQMFAERIEHFQNTQLTHKPNSAILTDSK